MQLVHPSAVTTNLEFCMSTLPTTPESSSQSIGIPNSLYRETAMSRVRSSAYTLVSTLLEAQNLISFKGHLSWFVTTRILCWRTYFSSNLYIFFRAGSQGRFGSSVNDDTCFSSFIKSWYSKDASLSASAFPSGQSKCFRTARSSTYQTHD